MKTEQSLLGTSVLGWQLVAVLTGLSGMVQVQAASTIQFASGTYTVAEDAGTVSITVRRSGDVNTTVGVDYATLDGSATNGVKYTAVSGTLAFGPGETNQTIVIPILNDGVVGGPTIFRAALSNPSGGAVLGLAAVATVQIKDNDTGIRFEVAAYSVAEDAGSVLIGVVRGNDVSLPPFTVDYATADGSAAGGVDYTGATNTLSFAAGETVKLVTIPILNDGIREPSKTFRVSLSNPSGGGVLGSPNTTTVTILDNDPGAQFEFNNYWVHEGEGSVLIGVLRGNDGDFPATVEFTTGNGTARAGQDYAGTNGVLNFAAGEKVQFFTVPILNDGVKEPDETFLVYLTNVTGGILGSPTTATITILDNDPGIQFNQNQLWVHEDEGAVLLAVTRGNDGLLDAFTVNFATTNGTAIAGNDYTGTNGILAFAAGEMSRSIAVPILKAIAPQKDRTFKVLLSNPTGGMLLGAAANLTAKVTICDTREMLPHRLDALQVSAQGTVSLTLGGGYTPGVGVVNRFLGDFDIYPLEVSTNLVDWVPLTWLARTNADTNLLTFVDSAATGFAQRFYRTPAKPFPAPQRVPTGSYAVGFTDRTVTDATRRNRYRISTNSSFPITIWYPAERVVGPQPGMYERQPVARDPNDWAGYIDRAPYWRSYSVSNAPFAKGLERLPVAFWSHGYLDVRNDGQELAEHLASHGYIVVGLDHLDGSFVVYPDGAYIYTDVGDTAGRELDSRLVQQRIRDVTVALDALSDWNQNDVLFAGMVDVQNVAVVGFSLGGATAGEFCRLDKRCLAAVALDPGGFDATPTLNTLGLQKPSLTMHNPTLTDDILFSKAAANAYWFQIRNTEHTSFSTWYWSVTSTSLANTRETARTIADWTLWFLNKYLKGSTDPMPRTADYPQIINFKQK